MNPRTAPFRGFGTEVEAGGSSRAIIMGSVLAKYKGKDGFRDITRILSERAE
ncbi:MAG TPA: hypothetical protein PKI20_20615 [Verrucomicrobiota bacterium]|nr:hypothetical protein [Verrucomicrobiota bacterium]